MTAPQDILTQAEAVELVKEELDMGFFEATKWLKKNFGSVGGMKRGDVMSKIAKVKARLRNLPSRPWNTSKDDPEDEPTY